MFSQKSTKVLVIVACISVCLAVITVFLQSPKGTLQFEDTQFAIADSGSVNKIILFQKGKSVVLSQNNGIWKANGTFLAEKTLVENLKNLVYKVQIRKLVSKDLLPKLQQLLQTEATELCYYNGEKLLKKVKFIADSKELVGMIDGYKIPYFIDFPVLGKVPFSNIIAADVQNWRSRAIFISQPSTINQLKVTYFDSTKYSFEINRGTSKFEIKNMLNADSAKIMAYLELYKEVTIRRYCADNEQYKKDSLLKITPTFSIDLLDKFNEKSNAILIYYANNQKTDIYGLVGKSKELCVIKPRVFEYLLQKRYFFEAKK